jgi:hypothetical protein
VSQIRDTVDDGEVDDEMDHGKHVRIAALDAYLTDLSPADPSPTRTLSRVFGSHGLDAPTFLGAKPHCFVLYPLQPNHVSGRSRRFRRAHSRTFELVETSLGMNRGPSRGPSRAGTPDSTRSKPQSSGIPSDDDDSDELVSDGSLDIRRPKFSARKQPRPDNDLHRVDPGFLVVDATAKKQSLVVSVVIPDGDGLSEATRMQLRERAPMYQAQQLQAWRDGIAIPMPVRDASPLDTVFGSRTTVHLSRIGFVHVKRFEDELKAVIESLRVCLCLLCNLCTLCQRGFCGT